MEPVNAHEAIQLANESFSNGRAVERSGILRFLRVDAEGYDVEAQKAAAQQRYEAAARFANKAAVLRFEIKRIEGADHLLPEDG